MGVYIPNMEKPKSCYNHCFEGFIADKDIGCPLNDYIESHQYKSRIHPDCPLIDIVKCGECKWWDRDGKRKDGKGWCENVICGLTKPNAFCSYGERRADE